MKKKLKVLNVVLTTVSEDKNSYDCDKWEVEREEVENSTKTTRANMSVLHCLCVDTGMRNISENGKKIIPFSSYKFPWEDAETY